MNYLEYIEKHLGYVSGFVASLGIIYGFINEKSREFIFRNLNINKSKAEIKRETFIADSETLILHITTIKNLSIEIDQVYNQMAEARKQKFLDKHEIERLKYEQEINNEKVKNNCSNNCMTK